jgi:DOMON domain/Copper type II ascorbate-dependent monooxygenase, N-terminal domain
VRNNVVISTAKYCKRALQSYQKAVVAFNLHDANKRDITMQSQGNMYRSLLVVLLIQGVTDAATVSTCFGGIDNAPYLDWVNTKGTSYASSECFPSKAPNTTQGIAVHWRVDDENIHIAVAARAEGWVGFGIAETGGMKGADIIIFEAANPTVVRDAHVLDAFYPIDDICQDWVLSDSSTDDGYLIFEAYRKLNTRDTQDRVIINDTDTTVLPQIVIAAWGDSAAISFHGSNIAQGRLRWYSSIDEVTLFREAIAMKANGFFDLAVNHTLQAIETDYVDFCFTWDPDITGQHVANGTLTAIAFEMFLSEKSRKFLHHATLFASTEKASGSKVCLENSGFPIAEWAPGVQPYKFPDEVGIKIGPSSDNTGIQSFRFQIHYDNPSLVPNVTDITVMRIYYSLKPSKYELGVTGMGDFLSYMFGTNIPAGISQFDFSCSSECSSLVLDEPITVIGETFHMHSQGLSAKTYQIRNNEVVRQAGVDFYDFKHAGKMFDN